MLDQQTLVKNLMTGKDGRLLVEFDGNMEALIEVDSFSVKANYSNIDYQPVGSYQKFGVPSDVSYTLTYTEAVVRDDVVMEPLLAAAAAGKNYSFVFQAMTERPDGEEQRLTLRECIPDGEFDLMSLTPGEIIKRNTSFRVNSVPEWVSKLTGF